MKMVASLSMVSHFRENKEGDRLKERTESAGNRFSASQNRKRKSIYSERPAGLEVAGGSRSPLLTIDLHTNLLYLKGKGFLSFFFLYFHSCFSSSIYLETHHKNHTFIWSHSKMGCGFISCRNLFSVCLAFRNIRL